MANEKTNSTELSAKTLKHLIAFYDWDRNKLADAIDCKVQDIYNWEHRGRISAKKAVLADKATKGKIKKEDLRPDVTFWFI